MTAAALRTGESAGAPPQVIYIEREILKIYRDLDI